LSQELCLLLLAIHHFLKYPHHVVLPVRTVTGSAGIVTCPPSLHIRAG